jgi:hypothetical protein
MPGKASGGEERRGRAPRREHSTYAAGLVLTSTCASPAETPAGALLSAS